MTPNVLDLCCAAGGVSVGLEQAGFNVVGVDIEYQPRYPERFEFYQEDLTNISAGWVRRNFDFVWASPPCQAFTALRTMHNAKEHINLIPDARRLIERAGLPAVIENVVGAPLRDPIMLRGTMFDLHTTYQGHRFQLTRERIFETHGWTMPKPPVDKFSPDLPVIGVYGGHARNRSEKWGGRGTKDFEGDSQKRLASEAMGINWMSLADMSQAIPPAYSKWIGESFLDWREANKNARRVGL